MWDPLTHRKRRQREQKSGQKLKGKNTLSNVPNTSNASQLAKELTHNRGNGKKDKLFLIVMI